MFQFNYQPQSKLLKFEQIKSEIVRNIENGSLANNSFLPSINEFSIRYNLSRVTITRAYQTLRSEGYIGYAKNRGFYVICKGKANLRALLIAELGGATTSLYKGLIEILAENCKLDFYVLTDDIQDLQAVLYDGCTRYDCLLIKPGENTRCWDFLKFINEIPCPQLILLGKHHMVQRLECGAVYWEIEKDIDSFLMSNPALIAKYNRVVVLLSGHVASDAEIVDSMKHYCRKTGRLLSISVQTDHLEIVRGTLYLSVSDVDLIQLIDKIRVAALKIGEDIGILTVEDNLLKRSMDVTSINTDFCEIGKSAGLMILEKRTTRIKHSSAMVLRSSL